MSEYKIIDLHQYCNLAKPKLEDKG